MSLRTLSLRKKASLAGAALILPLALSACGTTDPGAAASSAPTEATSGDCADVATSTEPVSLTDSFGRTVELDKPAERVAVLEWQQVEDALTLCVNPVAVADVKGYATWNDAEELPEGVADVGTRGEPNLDALYATDPTSSSSRRTRPTTRSSPSSRPTTCRCWPPRAPT